MGDTFTITQVIITEITINEPFADGHIYYAGSTYTNNEDGGITFGQGIISTIYRGYIEWDISIIPNNATIDVIKFIYDCVYSTNDGHIHESVGTRPSTASALTIWNECGEGWIYAQPDGFPVVKTNQIVTLGATSAASACVELQAQLSNNWFAIGLQGNDEGTENKYAYIRDSTQEAAVPKPSLYVEYNVTSTCTLNQPNTITRSHTRKTESHLFPDGTFKRHDIGSGGKTITLGGTEISSATVNFNTIDIMKAQGEYITLSDMNNSDLNTNWFIADFDWSQNEGYVDRYDYTMILKEVG